MPNFKIIKNDQGQTISIETDLEGPTLLDNAKLNKGCAFTQEERKLFHIQGRLPEQVESLDQQCKRLYQQYLKKSTDLQKNIYLNSLHDINETLFYKLVSLHLKEMLPIVYTPTVGEAVEQFSLEFRKSRGLYLSYPDKDHIEEILEHRLNPEIDLIVMTDGEGVLGIGDQGIGGMDIPIAKLMVYTLCAGINPHRVLPIQIDVGTNNEKLLNDPMYLGWRHERLKGKEYDDFIDIIVKAIQKKFPKVFLHWEDFGRDNARKNLLRYRDEMCTFNDDMQGTGAVTLAAILSGVSAAKSKLTEQRVVVFGAGTAGAGIADQIYDAMIRSGLSEKEARSRFYLIDRQGLLLTNTEGLMPFQKPYARDPGEVTNWKKSNNIIGLEEVINNVKATILIGCSTRTGAFTENIIKTMAAHTEHPIIFPLSNPTEKAEAKPEDLMKWTNGKALIATGSPFDDVVFNGKKIRVSQCNNAFVFPGLGLGIIVAKAKSLTDDVIWAACQALAEQSPAKVDSGAPLLPDIGDAKKVSMKMALVVANKIREVGLSQVDDKVDFTKVIASYIWEPEYYPYRKK